MNPLLTTKAETFRSGTDNLEFYHNRLIKLTNGVLLFCSGGEAEITIDLEKHHIIPNTNIMLLPGSILSLRSASPDFQIHYFAYSGEMMKVACFRLDPAFMHFMKENSCYTHTRLETIRPILSMIEASTAIYADKEISFAKALPRTYFRYSSWILMIRYRDISRRNNWREATGKDSCSKSSSTWYIPIVPCNGM